MVKLHNKLTPQQLRFADAIIEGKAPSVAYRIAYPNGTPNTQTVAKESHTLRNHPKIAAYIEECLADRRREVLLTRDKKRQILGSIALDKTAPKQARIAAIKEDNVMTGDAAPVRVEGEITLFGIFRSLAPAVGLPSPDELKVIEVEAKPVRKAVAGPQELPEDEKTAMERATG